MNIKRAFLVLAAALLMPGLALAVEETTVTVDLLFVPADTAATTATITCSGVVAPIVQSDGPLGHLDDTTFIIQAADLTGAACDVTVSAVNGYTAIYSDDCSLLAGEMDEGPYTCTVTMTAADVTFTVTKVWDTTRVGGDLLDPSYDITISCDEEITSPTVDCDDDAGVWWCEFSASGILPKSFSVDVLATGSHPHCWAKEDIVDSAVEVDNGCSSKKTINVGESGSCIITNTVFYEGIPTLNQYGLAIMALLMLGVGFVGFRRFV